MALGLLLLAALCRMAWLGHAPFIWSEAEVAQMLVAPLACLSALSPGAFFWQLWHLWPCNVTPLMGLYPFVLPLVQVVGMTEAVVRFPAALSGTLTCWVVYRLVRRWSPPPVPLATLALLALNPFLIIFHRSALPDSVQVLAFFVGVLCLDHVADAWRWGWALGAMTGFAVSVLVKLNALIFVGLILGLYAWHRQLSWRSLGLVVLGSVGVGGLLFADQLPQLWQFVSGNLRLGSVMAWDHKLLDARFYARAHWLYAEQTVLPLALGWWFRRRLTTPGSRIAWWFLLLYPVALVLQGRTFFRYLQVEVVWAAVVVAYVVARHPRWLWGLLCWGLLSHSGYVWSQHATIPFRRLTAPFAQESPGTHWWILGHQPEVEYYVAPADALWMDRTKNPCLARLFAQVQQPLPTDSLQRLSDHADLATDPLPAPGDVVVVAGMGMDSGEPNPWSVTSWVRGVPLPGIRHYHHALFPVERILSAYATSPTFRARYVPWTVWTLTGGTTPAVLLFRRTEF